MTQLDQKAILRILLEIDQRLNEVLTVGEKVELILVGSARYLGNLVERKVGYSGK